MKEYRGYLSVILTKFTLKQLYTMAVILALITFAYGFYLGERVGTYEAAQYITKFCYCGLNGGFG